MGAVTYSPRKDSLPVTNNDTKRQKILRLAPYDFYTVNSGHFGQPQNQEEMKVVPVQAASGHQQQPEEEQPQQQHQQQNDHHPLDDDDQQQGPLHTRALLSPSSSPPSSSASASSPPYSRPPTRRRKRGRPSPVLIGVISVLLSLLLGVVLNDAPPSPPLDFDEDDITIDNETPTPSPPPPLKTPLSFVQPLGSAKVSTPPHGRPSLTMAIALHTQNLNPFPIYISDVHLQAFLPPNDNAKGSPQLIGDHVPEAPITIVVPSKGHHTMNVTATFFLDATTADSGFQLAAECLYASGRKALTNVQAKVRVGVINPLTWQQQQQQQEQQQQRSLLFWMFPPSFLALFSLSSPPTTTDEGDANNNFNTQQQQQEWWQSIEEVPTFRVDCVTHHREAVTSTTTTMTKESSSSSFSSSSSELNGAPAVKLPCGHTVIGRREEGRKVDEYLGLRYAHPPIENQRWKPPKVDHGCIPAHPKVILARTPAPACPQPGGGEGQDEDCLFINVLTPSDRRDDSESSSTAAARKIKNGSASSSSSSSSSQQLLPVLLYLHGGGLVAGSGSDPGGLRTLVEEAGGGGRLVAVSINYRLNVLGFLTTAALSEENGGHSGNYGLLDQQAALRWVQQNIAAFGGDPQRVTLVGHSSGGTSILALLASPASRGLFQGAISLSGSPNITMDAVEMERANQDIVTSLGCSDAGNGGGHGLADASSSSRGAANTATAGEMELHCLRNLTAEEVVNAMPYPWFTQGVFGLPSGPEGMDYPALPVIDGHVLTLPLLEAYGSGLVDVPIMLGNVAEEPDLWPGAKVGQFTPQEWQLFLNKTFENFGGSVEDVGMRLYEAYEDDLEIERGGDPQRAYDALVTDIGLTCANIKVAQSAAAASAGGGDGENKKKTRKSPTYLFVNTMTPSTQIGPMGTYPNSEVPYYGRYAFHGWDLTVAMKSFPFEPTAAELVSSQRLMDTWLAFMEDADKGLQELGWLPADQTPDWPETWNVLVQGTSAFELVQGYKADICRLIDEVGLGGPEFWWAN